MARVEIALGCCAHQRGIGQSPGPEQKLLLRLLDPDDAASVEVALEDVLTIVPDGVSGFGEYVQDAGENGRLIGCEWRGATFL